MPSPPPPPPPRAAHTPTWEQHRRSHSRDVPVTKARPNFPDQGEWRHDRRTRTENAPFGTEQTKVLDQRRGRAGSMYIHDNFSAYTKDRGPMMIETAPGVQRFGYSSTSSKNEDHGGQ